MHRRVLIKKSFWAFWGISAGFMLIPGCGQNKERGYQMEKATDCKDLTGLPEQEKSKRQDLGYQEVSPIPENTCGNCQLYLPGNKNRKCGGCQLFKGPVLEDAYCTYWAPRTASV